MIPSRGYTIFMNSGDKFHTNFQLSKFVKNNKNKDYDFVWGNSIKDNVIGESFR